MNRVELNIYLSAEEFMAYYQGRAQSVLAFTASGQSIQFPAAVLRPFLSHKGVQGRFSLAFDNNGKLQDLQRIL